MHLLLRCLAAAAMALGCSANDVDRARFSSGIPGMTTPVEVVSVQRRGPYLQAALVLAGRDAEGWALASEACRSVFVAGSEIAFRSDGPLGSWVRGEFDCQSSGLGPVSLVRDRSSHATARGIPRSQANYRTIYVDRDLALLRGVFSEARHLGYTNTSDLVAVVPRGGNCEAPIASGVASLEYRSNGPNPLSLLGPKGPCTVRAMLVPPGNLEMKEEASQG